MFENGVLLGKFMPLHKGHEFLFNFAQNCSKRTTILVDHLEGETIPVSTRVSWVKEVAPFAKVIGVKEKTPQAPNEHPCFWHEWNRIFRHYEPHFDALFASAYYAKDLAKALNVPLISCDVDREHFSISATEIRNDLYSNWSQLSVPAQRYHQRKISFIGPESCGKTVAAKCIQERLQEKKINSQYIPEYAEEFLRNGGEINEDALDLFILAQNSLSKTALKTPSAVLLVDSDYISTIAWSKTLYGKELVPPKEPVVSDLTLLFTPETVWINDAHRLESQRHKESRWKFFEVCQNLLVQEQRKFIIIDGGDYEERIKKALTAIINILPFQIPRDQ